MKEKINKLVEQLSEAEQKELEEYIERHYALILNEFDKKRQEVEEIVFREIRTYIDNNTIIVHGCSRLSDLGIDAVGLVDISDILSDILEVKEAEFSEVMKWDCVSDIVKYIEDEV